MHDSSKWDDGIELGIEEDETGIQRGMETSNKKMKKGRWEGMRIGKSTAECAFTQRKRQINMKFVDNILHMHARWAGGNASNRGRAGADADRDRGKANIPREIRLESRNVLVWGKRSEGEGKGERASEGVHRGQG